MRGNSVIIATNASFLAGVLRDKLRDAEFQVFTAANDNDLTAKIKAAFPRFVFLEHCFHGHGTDSFVQRLTHYNQNARIVVWTAAEVKPLAAARFILAGAESFFSLRDTDSNIETIICRIAGGRRYCPADVETELEKDCAFPVIGEELTRREIEIMKMSVEGKTNQQIGDTLSVSVHTVKYHKANIYRKCGGNTPVDILRNGLIRGIIHTEDFI
jgi:DNA-binding NarL/FixJ family response regulator